ncbi:hypothetical protein HYV70_03845 [Candidatus Uhrbacteria bacterium]|nr:hypothetical protein [Candidatus Uhrbacteria bacterium]
MNSEKRSDERELITTRFRKYGIEFLRDGSISGPKKPRRYGKTPEFIFEDHIHSALETQKTFLRRCFEEPFSVVEHKDAILDIVDKIIQEIIGESFRNFANIIILSSDDFEEFAKKMSPKLKQTRGVEGDFQGMNLGGLIIMQDTGGNNCFPLLFHEIGHTLYPDEQDTYIDELRAMYFQILCTKKLEKELEKIKINMSYSDDYYKDLPLPSDDHRRAFQDARILFIYQSFYDEIVKDNARAEKLEKELLEKIKQPHKKSLR